MEYAKVMSLPLLKLEMKQCRMNHFYSNIYFCIFSILLQKDAALGRDSNFLLGFTDAWGHVS